MQPLRPVPEPAGDIRAQIAATLDPAHPKAACWATPQDSAHFAPYRAHQGVHVVDRHEGSLLTRRADLAQVYTTYGDDDRAMAEILGIPEAKPDFLIRCGGNWLRWGRAVQARDRGGHVVQEALASPLMLLRTAGVLEGHVPVGGSLAVLYPAIALSRRVAMRWLEE